MSLTNLAKSIFHSRHKHIQYLDPFTKTLTEVLFVLVVSNFSLVVAIFVYLVNTSGTSLSLELMATVTKNNVRSTEILVYLLAIIAPTLWIMVSNWRARRHAGFFWLLFFLQILIIIGSSYIYGAAKAGSVANDSFVDVWALICLISTVLCWYATLVYEKKVLSAVDAFPRNSADGGDDILTELRGSIK